MSLWVRSQDKKTLVKVDVVELLNYENSIVAYTSIKVVDLGKYSTQEKALKVLDMIVEQINLTEEYRTQGEDVIESENSVARKSRLVRFVFQMPQDDEVEE